jgi:hypothetical protein
MYWNVENKEAVMEKSNWTERKCPKKVDAESKTQIKDQLIE